MTYRVYRSRPITEPTGEITHIDGETIRWHSVVRWPLLGYADSYAGARAQFGGRPVLEWTGEPQVIQEL